jgi:hypothetical protein
VTDDSYSSRPLGGDPEHHHGREDPVAVDRSSRPGGSSVRHWVAAGAALLLSLAVAAPVAARPIEKATFEDTSIFTDCDGLLAGVSVVSGWDIIKDATPATGGQFFYFETRNRFTDTLTNTATGKSFTVSGTSFFRENQARLVEGTVFTYVSHEMVNIVIRDADGKVVLRDVGLIETSYVFDTLGESTPGGVYVEEPELVRVVGPHPSFDESFDFCALAAELTA